MTTQTRPVVRLAAVTGIAFGALTLAASPASAGSSGVNRSSGTTASIQWIEYGELPGIAGNAHVGDMFVDGTNKQAYVYGSINDWTCPPGERPPSGGGHGIEDDHVPPPETNCTNEGSRYINNEPGDVTFTLDTTLKRARLKGTIQVSAHSGSARPPIDITLKGYGNTTTETQKSTYDDGTTQSTFKYTNTYRRARASGRMGPMDFTDDVDDESTATIGTYKSMSRYRSR